MDNQKDMQVLTMIKKDILNRVLVKNYTDLIGHLYCSILDIKEFYSLLRKVLKKTKVINLYDIKVDRKQL